MSQQGARSRRGRVSTQDGGAVRGIGGVEYFIRERIQLTYSYKDI
jgi:hypothetical protein